MNRIQINKKKYLFYKIGESSWGSTVFEINVNCQQPPRGKKMVKKGHKGWACLFPFYYLLFMLLICIWIGLYPNIYFHASMLQ